MSWGMHSRGKQEKTPNEQKVNRASHAAMTTSFPLSRPHSKNLSTIGFDAKRARSRMEKPCARKRTMCKLLEPLLQELFDDDAALIRNFPLSEKEARRNPLGKTTPPSVSFLSSRSLSRRLLHLSSTTPPRETLCQIYKCRKLNAKIAGNLLWQFDRRRRSIGQENTSSR